MKQQDCVDKREAKPGNDEWSSHNFVSGSGPMLTLREVALLLWDDGLTDRILPRNYVQMIEKRALAKLRRDPRIR
ncbi:MAG: hypothetical protein HQ559_14670 [Lentisphaerae bacterium]|nr:hypothetical protein [Lentisphaerota bacterium]